MAKGKPVTEAEYDIAKMLLKNTTVSVAAKALGRAPVTVSYIKNTENYKDYVTMQKERMASINNAKKSKNASPQKPILVPDTKDKAPEILFDRLGTIEDILKLHTALLNTVNDKLDLAAVPKRRLF